MAGMFDIWRTLKQGPSSYIYLSQVMRSSNNCFPPIQTFNLSLRVVSTLRCKVWQKSGKCKGPKSSRCDKALNATSKNVQILSHLSTYLCKNVKKSIVNIAQLTDLQTSQIWHIYGIRFFQQEEDLSQKNVFAAVEKGIKAKKSGLSQQGVRIKERSFKTYLPLRIAGSSFRERSSLTIGKSPL